MTCNVPLEHWVSYLSITAGDLHPSVRPLLGQRLDGGVVVFDPRQTVAISTQEGLLLAAPLNLHHCLLDHTPIWWRWRQ